MPQAIFSSLKNADSDPQTFAQLSKNPTKHSVVVIVRAIHATKTKTVWKIRFLFGSFQLSTKKILYTRYLFPGAHTPRQVQGRVTPGFWRVWSWPGHANELSRRCAIHATGTQLWSDILPTSQDNLMLVTQCFEPSQPLRIISGLKTNFSPSPSYSAHKLT